jgi:hypothetical protein
VGVSVAMIVGPDGDAEQKEIHRRFHLNAGVDAVVPPGAPIAADWLIETSPDEFWWPRGGTLKDVLASVPGRYDALRAVVRSFVPVAEEGSFVERMIYRLSPQAPVAEGSCWHPHERFVHRTASAGRRTLKGWYPIEVLRFPLEAGTAEYDRERLQSAVAMGILRIDTRLRDAVRALDDSRSLVFPYPDALDEAEFALDVAVLGEANVIRTQRRLDELEERLAAVESTFPAIFKRRLRALVRMNRREDVSQ